MAIQFFDKKKKRPSALKSEYNRSQIIKVLKQSGSMPNIPRDKSRDAKLPGKRISRTGKVYWETRKNRSDISAVTKL